MKPILTRLFAGMFLLLASQAFGQLSTSFVVTSPAGPFDYPIGTQIVIELRVNNFTNIESMQFPITYNKDAMQFDSIGSAAFSNWNAGNYVSVPSQGKIGISWDGYSGGANMPFSFPNGTAIFKLYFTAIGNGISSVNISNSAAPPAIDVVGNGQPVVLNYQSGGTPPLTLGTGVQPVNLVGFKIVANTIYIPQGERGCMPVTVNDFDNIVSMQWAMHWDNTVLNFECTRSYNLTGWSATDFNSTFSPGTLLAGWSDPAGIGVTRADGARIVDVCFKAIGAPGATTTITIDGVGFPMGNGTAEAYNSSSVNVWTTGGANGASGVSAPVSIITNPASPFDVTFNVDTINAAPGSQACAAVRVKNFSAVTSAEFALAFNQSELTLVNTNPVQFGSNPLGLLAGNVNTATAGTVKFNWTNAAGKTVASDSAIFTLCFNVIAPTGTKSNISFTSTACPTVTGIGTAKANGGVSMGRNNGWIKSIQLGPIPSVTNVNCNGASTGAITITNPVGTTATGYSWAGPGINGSTQKDVTGLAAGTYTVTVTYSNGTTGTAVGTVTQPVAPISQTNMVNTVSCFLGTNGAINLTPAGGTAPYSFMWTHGATTEDLNNLAVGIYTVTIKDVKNCTFGPTNITVSGFNEMKIMNSVVSDVTCAGLSTGSIVNTYTGGAGGYTFKWSNGSTTKDLMNVPKGTYAVTLTDLNGCTKVFNNLNVNEPQPLTASLVSKTDVKCAGSATGTAVTLQNGGTGNKTYCWSSGAGPCASDVPNPTNLPAGTFTLIVTDEKGCTTTLPGVVIAAPTNGPVVITGSGTSANCFGQATGSIDMTINGGWGSFTYAWSGGNAVLPPIPDPTNVPPGTYTLTTTDAGQCTTTQTVTVGGPQTDVSAATTINNVTCFNANDGAIDLNLIGGNGGPYTVIWSNTTLSGEAISNLAPGTYQPTVTYNGTCTKILPAVTVTGPDVLLVDTSITAANPNNGAIDLVVMSGGTGNPTTWQYNWSGPGGFTAATQDISNLATGTYTVTITDSNSCIHTSSFTVPSGNVLGGTTYTTTNACNHDGCITFNFPATSAAATPFTINWGTGTKQTSALTETICNFASGVYNVTITAANGNSMVLGGVQIGQNEPASVNSNSQSPFSSLTKNGKITLTPFPGVQCQLTYLWSTGATTSEVSNLGQGTFTVTVTNPCSGCTSVQEFPLTYSPLASINNVQNPTCANTANGAINLNIQGGNLPYVYLWSNGATTEDLADLLPGVYSVTATDADNRLYNEIFILNSQSNLSITNVNETSQYGPFQVSGNAMCDGEAAVVFTPGVGNALILWSNGVTTLDNSTLCGGAYSVTVTDATGCTSVWTDELSAPPALTATTSSDGVACYGDCNGSAKVYPAGGVAPYFIEWPSGQAETIQANGFSRAVNLCGGGFAVTITDNNGVKFNYNVDVPQPAEIAANIAPTTPRNFNACDGELLINVSGAVAPITYVWSGSFGHTGTGERAGNLCSGEFVEFYITDANGCTAYVTDSVPYPEDGCFRVSPVITPGQQDGKNDNVIITCIHTAVTNTMEIYNRWGQLVFKTEDYNNNDADRDHNWNGLTKGGEVLAEGVYYYVLTFSYVDDQGITRESTRKGAINLLR